jgi:hypothetical protein
MNEYYLSIIVLSFFDVILTYYVLWLLKCRGVLDYWINETNPIARYIIKKTNLSVYGMLITLIYPQVVMFAIYILYKSDIILSMIIGIYLVVISNHIQIIVGIKHEK